MMSKRSPGPVYNYHVDYVRKIAPRPILLFRPQTAPSGGSSSSKKKAKIRKIDQTPGPGNYEIQSFKGVGSDSAKFTFGGRPLEYAPKQPGE